MAFPILTLTVFTPLVGIIVVLLLPERWVNGIRAVAVAFTAAALAFSIWALAAFDPKITGAMQLEELHRWIPSVDIFYHLGVDGLSMPFIILTTLLSFLAAIASFSIKERVKEYFALYLLLETGMLGVFVALDLFLFYVFWEVMLVPMYFLIGIWGGEKREYAAIKFFLYTLLGSVVMLLGILALYFTSQPHTFDMLELMRQRGTFVRAFQIIVFLAFYVGFAIKVPVFPFHTWLPDAHVEAPTAISVLLAGVLLKMGGYGLLRVSYPILPQGAHWFVWPLAILGVINIVYGSLVAMAQKDLKKLIAYSSVGHMGFVLLGAAAMTPTALDGAVMQMVTHGIITGALFLLVGVLYDRAHVREISAFSGLGVRVPVYVGIMSFTMIASLGLPGLAGFVSEFLSLVGSFPVFPVLVIISGAGIIITAAYFLWTIRRMFLGTLTPRWENLPDINFRELVTVVPLMILTVLIGVYPSVLIKLMDPALTELSRVMATLK
ncbi:MAG: NADH-quinone oxidoreductase subunit M [candidate division Zixibacteria bacterium]|nr:NADH-quinone oxidoreductase subunit M [candidate division Zixibacteria bacterium]